MPRPREEFDDLREFEFRDPEEVLDAEQLYTVYEIARLLQGLAPGTDLDPATEDILLDWAIPWMLDHSESFVFAEPEADDEPGYYGLR
ncbi:MAG: DUF5827 family protein [Natronomonas sp.]|jgi:hypothetical protein|uniref:Uncharacterized protein n=1 Tax=Natronomonas salsuginis TaxID=2217661 RepID=A0A4U5JFK8_9EURY|nr:MULTISPECIES: DUF5827 family protein [Natronomonas]MDR9430360.1 DUF5827 family protein [Natronomonas sp.]TKR28172.1 hypothetical protein DM868_03580 [Natronomonas salsuginis]